MPSSDDRIRRLGAEHARLTARLERLEASQRRETEPLPADFSEQVQQRGNDSVIDELESGTRDALQQLEHAIERITQHRGDFCEDCDQPIDAARLKALPAATRCRACQEKRTGR